MEPATSFCGALPPIFFRKNFKINETLNINNKFFQKNNFLNTIRYGKNCPISGLMGKMGQIYDESCGIKIASL